MTKQSQTGGDQSINLQTENVIINNGVTYPEVKEIALDVFNSNFLKLSEQAAHVAAKRAEEITEIFLEKLSEQNPIGITQATTPDFQHALFTVQKEYAKSGDKELGDLLVDLLVDRTKHDTRSILQIVLNESLSVAPKLTNDQINALSLIFLFKHTHNYAIHNISIFAQYLDNCFTPLTNYLAKQASCYQHLAYSGCGSISMGESSISDIFRKRYSGIFLKGFTIEEFDSKGIVLPSESDLVIPCFQDPTKFQFNAITEEELYKKAQALGFNHDDTFHKFVSLYQPLIMNNTEIKECIIKLCPFMTIIYEVWEQSYMKNFVLSSVGIALGHANTRRYLGQFAKLSIWIN